MTSASPDLAALHKALTALAAEVERQSRQLADQHTAIARAQESADHAHRVLVDIVDRVKELADKITTAGAARTPQAEAPIAWLIVEDENTARAALADLIDWLHQVYIHYPGAAESLGECWLWHPTAIEELMALRAAWQAAYTGPEANAARAIDWHDRHLPGVQRRLRAALADCSLAAHRPGGRADKPHSAVPGGISADQLATWWTTTHGTTGAPAPSLEATADPYQT